MSRQYGEEATNESKDAEDTTIAMNIWWITIAVDDTRMTG